MGSKNIHTVLFFYVDTAEHIKKKKKTLKGIVCKNEELIY